jgi:hypothetical protein
MAPRLIHVRLNTAEVEELTRCLTRLNHIYDSVNATGMAGKAAIMGTCVEVYRAIERVLAKEMAAVKRWQVRSKGTQGDQGGEEPAPSD